jgi:hypothetical protein
MRTGYFRPLQRADTCTFSRCMRSERECADLRLRHGGRVFTVPVFLYVLLCTFTKLLFSSSADRADLHWTAICPDSRFARARRQSAAGKRRAPEAAGPHLMRSDSGPSMQPGCSLELAVPVFRVHLSPPPRQVRSGYSARDCPAGDTRHAITQTAATASRGWQVRSGYSARKSAALAWARSRRREPLRLPQHCVAEMAALG